MHDETLLTAVNYHLELSSRIDSMVWKWSPYFKQTRSTIYLRHMLKSISLRIIGPSQIHGPWSDCPDIETNILLVRCGGDSEWMVLALSLSAHQGTTFSLPADAPNYVMRLLCI